MSAHPVNARRIKDTVGQESINQIEHMRETGARMVTGDIQAVGRVITTDVSAAGVLVGKGAVLRIQAAADTYISFGPVGIAAVTSSTTPAFKHPGGYVLLNATDDYIRASAAFTRMEVVHEA